MTVSKPLAVHLHLYYTQMWDEIRQYLENLNNYPYDLYVTLTEENPELMAAIKSFHADTQIWVVENRGYDVGPFIDFLHHIDLDKYDLILKLHTKNKTAQRGNGLSFRGLSLNRCQWRDILYKSLIGTPKNFAYNLNCFQKEDIGMLGAPVLIAPESKKTVISFKTVQQLLTEMGFSAPKKTPFIAGTMFFCRATLLQPIKDKFTIQDFPLSDKEFKKETLAHTLERLFGAIITAQGYQIAQAKINRLLLVKALINTIFHFFYQDKITRHHHRLIKICKIPVYRRELNI